MIWIDGEYFEPLLYGTFCEHAMIVNRNAEKLKTAIFDEILDVLSAIWPRLEWLYPADGAK